MSVSSDTIFALASGAPPAAIAIIRVSGPSALSAAANLSGGRILKPRRPSLRTIRAPDGTVLDRAILLYFEGPAAPTGEDVVEFHLHGGRAVVNAVEGALAQLPGLRPAMPGEFTRRAFENGQIDLTEAEGLADLLAAETETQRRAAMTAVEGRLRQAIERWTEKLLAIAASVEAELDFADEGDVGAGNGWPVDRAVRLAAEMQAQLRAPSAEAVRNGIRLVVAGRPNMGKSSLFNALCDREAAIVSPIAGTTRDLIEAPVQVGGVAYVLVDTAGLVDETDDPIERIGVDRAERAIARADLLLWCDDQPPPQDAPALWLYPRADERPICMDAMRIPVSIHLPESIDALWPVIAERTRHLIPAPAALPLNNRQRALSGEAALAILNATEADDLLVVAEHLRVARRALDRITGRADVEAMLDALFGRFCIGK